MAKDLVVNVARSRAQSYRVVTIDCEDMRVTSVAIVRYKRWNCSAAFCHGRHNAA
jgi:hypothetical protein